MCTEVSRRIVRQYNYHSPVVECEYWQFSCNPLAPDFFLILAHPVYKMWITQEQNKLALRNKLHFEEKKTEIIEHV